jgi:Transglutaminase-like superfamily/TgpA N-terminal domain
MSEWSAPDWLRRLARPREGWLAYFLLVMMLFSLAWSVQRAGWLKHEDFLIPVALCGSLLGAILALLPWSVVATLPAAAVAGTGVILLIVGGEYFPNQSIPDRLLSLCAEGLSWLHTVAQHGYPAQFSPYAIGLAVVMWVTAFMAAYTVYRHHRVLDAILLVGVTLIANLSATSLDLFGYLVLFVLAALLLWLRGSLQTREEGWRQRRVNENAEVPASIMRTGVVFIAVSIAMAWALGSVAVAAPLTDAWRNLDGIWSGVRTQLDRALVVIQNPNARLASTAFDSSFSVSATWFSSDDPVMTVSSDQPYYMQTATYDVYTGHGWSSTDGTDRDVSVKSAVFPDGSPEEPLTTDGFDVQRLTVAMQRPPGRNLFTPGYPLQLSAPATVAQPGGQPFLGALMSQNSVSPGEGYTVTAIISNVTAAQLRGAGTDYPAPVKSLYMSTDRITAATRDLAVQIVLRAKATTPFDKAQALANYLRNDPRFTYATSVDSPPADRDVVDYFLLDHNGQRGFCQYYASAMAVMARSLGLPARVAAGFAPGTQLTKNVYQYRESNAHVWAEIYFPGYGWQTFEATKSIAPVPRASGGDPRSVAPPIDGTNSPAPFEKRINKPDKDFASSSFRPIPGGVGTTSDTAGPGPAQTGNLLVILAILVVAVCIIGWRLHRSVHRYRLQPSGDRDWARLLRWAVLLLAAYRAGVSQRPSETDYEYAGWLEEQIPARRPEIQTIANERVYGSYSGRGMTSNGVDHMRLAWKRLWLPFIWLAIRQRADPRYNSAPDPGRPRST